jgi:putative component of membrane protein insertase Oxa1/YidC/SpoIIIJ protein YidD
MNFKSILELRFLNAACRSLIRLYHTHLDDKKGFKCAYKAVHCRNSCSHVMFRVLQRYPFVSALRLCYRQLTRCDEAKKVAGELPHICTSPTGVPYVYVAGAAVIVGACSHPPPDPTIL